MTKPSMTDLELLSAYLDGELPPQFRIRLESRLSREPELNQALADLRRTRAVLRRTPVRKSPRNFTLTPRMAGLRPPVPRLVPAFSWASLVAMLLFMISFGAGFLPQFTSLGARKMNAAEVQAPSTALGAGAVPQAPPGSSATANPTAPPAALFQAVPLPTESPAATPTPALRTADQSTQEDSTLLTSGKAASETTPVPTAQSNELLARTVPPVAPARHPISWIYSFPVLAVVLAASALVIRARAVRNFRKKLDQKSKV